MKNKVKISGTQKLDQMWRRLKRYIPYNVATKDRCTKRDPERLETYVWSYAWRYSNKTQVKEKLAKLAEKKRTKTLDKGYERKKKGTAKSCVLDEDILCMFSAVETRSNMPILS